jgi:hypothetical protein
MFIAVSLFWLNDELKPITIAEAGIDKHPADNARKFAARRGREKKPRR